VSFDELAAGTFGLCLSVPLQCIEKEEELISLLVRLSPLAKRSVPLEANSSARRKLPRAAHSEPVLDNDEWSEGDDSMWRYDAEYDSDEEYQGPKDETGGETDATTDCEDQHGNEAYEQGDADEDEADEGEADEDEADEDEADEDDKMEVDEDGGSRCRQM